MCPQTHCETIFSVCLSPRMCRWHSTATFLHLVLDVPTAESAAAEGSFMSVWSKVIMRQSYETVTEWYQHALPFSSHPQIFHK